MARSPSRSRSKGRKRSRSRDRRSRSRDRRSRDRSRGRDRDDRDRHVKKRKKDRRSRSGSKGKYGLEEQKKKDEQNKSDLPRQDDKFKDFQKVIKGDFPAPIIAPVAAKGVAPISMDSLKKIAQQKAQADEAKLKPLFQTKVSREEAALKRLQEKREAETKAKEDADEDRREMLRRRRREEREREEEERRKRQEERKKNKEERQKEKELLVLREQYLGQVTKKKAVVPPSQKFKFSFDWEPTDDTSQDLRGLYDSRQQVGLLFGRGFMGGQDRREQRKQMAFWDELIDDRKTNQADVYADARDAEKVKQRKERDDMKAKGKALQGRHWSEKRLDEMGERDWRIFKEDFSIGTRGNNVPNPLRYWSEAKLPEVFYKTLAKVGYKAPTPIQRAAIPIGLKNRDLVGIAETGSGKTCAFLLPLLVYLNEMPRLNQETAMDGPYSIIMAPTRELAQQISDECEKFSAPISVRSVSVIGGLSIQDQGVLVRKGAEVLIGTPGRIYDCIERRYLVLNQCSYVVLDEADRMIDLNFEPQIVRILETMPASNVKPENEDEIDANKRYRQTIMFSATMPTKVEMLARKYLRHPVFVSIGDRDRRTNDKIEQRVLWMAEGAKKKKLIDILSTEPPPFIVFMNNKKHCDKLVQELSGLGMRATAIHGGKAQDQRDGSLKMFKEGEFDILVGTDVVGRGIDVSGVEQVVNYDAPKDIERYTHRIGRTGRAGRSGIATSFITPQDTHLYYDLKEFLTKSNAAIPQELAKHEAAKTKPGAVPTRKPRSQVIFAK